MSYSAQQERINELAELHQEYCQCHRQNDPNKYCDTMKEIVALVMGNN